MQKMWQFSWMSRQLSAKSFGVSPYCHSSSSGRLEAYIVCFRESWDSVLVSFLTETVHRVLYTFILSFFKKISIPFYLQNQRKSKGKMLFSLSLSLPTFLLTFWLLYLTFSIKGTTAVEIASGLHWYLKYWCGAHVSWDKTGGVQIASIPKPGSLPHVKDKGVMIQRPVPWNYYQNVVTSSCKSYFFCLCFVFFAPIHYVIITMEITSLTVQH